MEQQHGHLSLTQAHELGASTRLIRSRERAGVLRRTFPSVTSVAGVPGSWLSSLWAAHLQLGPASLISHESAGQLHDYEGIVRDLVVLSITSTAGHCLPGVHVHRLVDLADHDVVDRDGLPVTSPARTIVDLAAVTSPGRLRHVVQGAVSDRRCSVIEIGATLARVRRRGKPGVSRLDRVLDDLAGEPIGRTRLEELLDVVLESLPVPGPVSQQPIADGAQYVGVVDRLFPDQKLIIEADGRRWHVRQQRMANDRRRDAEAAAMGFLTIRFMWEQLKSEPEWCRRVVLDALAHR